MNWQEQRRLNEAARAEQARQNALAAAQVEQIRARTQTEAAQVLAEQRAELDRKRRAERRQEQENARARRQARWTGLRAWVSAHTVDLLIYPLAVVSAVMAVPAMAAFGHDVYGNAAGYALPIITELGMWAFAFAVHVVRNRSEHDGADRPVWALQLGVWSFATVAAGLNFLHGLSSDAGPIPGLENGVRAGVVMAVASVAGVMAHQLVTAAPRRGRVERDAARIERQAAAKVVRMRRAAVRAAVTEIDASGVARLLFTPGHYRLTRSRFTPWRGQLDSIAVPGLPVTPALDSGWDALDQELANLISDAVVRPAFPTHGGGVDTLDRAEDQHESTSIPDSNGTPTEAATRPRAARKTSQKRFRKSSQQARSIEDLRAELHARIEADPSSIDPASAESIRRVLRCSPARARQLRDSYRPAD